MGGGVVGLYSIGTLAAYRRRGFGGALTLRPLLDARAEGHRIGSLQAAPGAVGIYARVGFAPFGEDTEYKPVRAASGSFCTLDAYSGRPRDAPAGPPAGPHAQPRVTADTGSPAGASARR